MRYSQLQCVQICGCVGLALICLFELHVASANTRHTSSVSNYFVRTHVSVALNDLCCILYSNYEFFRQIFIIREGYTSLFYFTGILFISYFKFSNTLLPNYDPTEHSSANIDVFLHFCRKRKVNNQIFFFSFVIFSQYLI